MSSSGEGRGSSAPTSPSVGRAEPGLAEALGLASLAPVGGRPGAIVLSGDLSQPGTLTKAPAPDGHPLVVTVEK